MKNLFYTCAVMLSALALTACSNEAEEAAAVENQQFTITASMGADTRTIAGTELNNGYYPTYWSEGDEIFVWGTDAEAVSGYLQWGYLTLQDYQLNQTSGTFKGLLYGSGSTSDLKYALYPTPTSVNNTYRIYKLRDKYTYGDDTNAPMYAFVEFNEDKTTATLNFQHLCGMVRLKVKGFKAERDADVTVTLGFPNLYIAGRAVVTYDSSNKKFVLAAPADSDKKNSIVYTIPKDDITGSDQLFILDFPVIGGVDNLNPYVKIESGGTVYLDEELDSGILIDCGDLWEYGPFDFAEGTDFVGNTGNMN